MSVNKAGDLLLRMRSEAIERAQVAMLVPFAGHAVAVLVLLCTFLGIIPIDLVVALAGVLIGSAALNLWAMWRVQEEITDVTGRVWVSCGVEVRIIEFQVPSWRIIGGE